MFRNTVIIMLFSALFLSSCGEKKTTPKTFPTLTASEIEALKKKVQELPNIPVTEDEKAVIKTSMGTIEFEFFPEAAPNHCANFKKLANAGFYDGVLFHRVVPGFVIQGGDILTRDDNPANDGSGDAGYKLNAEFSDIHHDRGIVSTARSPQSINSAGTQFFICTSPKYHLDGQYTVFGKVTKGMDVVDAIVAVDRDSRDRPKVPVVMEEVRVVKK